METQNAVVATYDGMNIEELIGFIQEEYPCVYCQVNGTLYVGTEGVAFIGKFYLFNKKVLLKWVDVKVQLIDHGIAFQTRQMDAPVVHEFFGIQNLDRVWSGLMLLHNAAILDQTKTGGGDGDNEMEPSGPSTARNRSATTQPIHRRKQLRRMTSDPTKLAPAIEELFDQHDINKEDLSELYEDSTNEKTTEASGNTTEQRQAQPTRRTSVMINKEHQLSTRAAEAFGNIMADNPLAGVEAIVGKIQGVFTCLYNRQQGKLYTGSTALYFSGERLLFPVLLVIQSSHIRQIKMVKSKPTATLASSKEPSVTEKVREQGIEICTHDGLSHTFLGMENPDQVWASLVTLRNHASAKSHSSAPFVMRRMNSDPNLTTQTNDIDNFVSPSKADGAAITTEPELALPVLSEEEMNEAWSDIMAKKSRYTTCVAKDHEVACSLDVYFKTFIADSAKFSLSNFMASRGDKDLTASKWKNTKQDGKVMRSRVVKYIHPVNAPMAPPEAKARKEQTYHRYGDLGFVVETKTFVDDVPMTDCFYAKDRLIVTPKEGTKHVLLTMEIELEFVKSTMFRGLITKTTTGEMTKFFVAMKDYISESLGEEVPEKPELAELPGVMVTEETTLLFFGYRPSILAIFMLGGVIVLQFMILLEMYFVKRQMQKIAAMYSPAPRGL